MKKLDRWDLKFSEWLESIQKKQFEWGKFDCVLIACDCIKALTTVDIAEEHRGKYDSESSAYKYLKKNFGSMEDAFNQHLGESVHPDYCQRGDVVLASVQGIDTMFVDTSEGYVMAIEGVGIRVVSKNKLPEEIEIKKGWRI